jgi:alpha-N-acetylglucosaminidase
LPVKNCRGVGTTLEGLNINPVAFDLLFEQPWHKDAKVNLDTWINDYADRRAGRADPAVRKAWSILQAEIFTDDPDGLWGRQNFLQTVPSLQNPNKVPMPERQAALVSVVDSLLAADTASRTADGYQYDLVNLTRQTLGNATFIIGKRLMAAADRKDLAAFRKEATHLLELGEDINMLLGTRHEWLMGRWIADARAWAATPAEADYYEHNAREILTTWHKAGGGLSDYARREWNGLFNTYYMGRWREFLQRVDQSLENTTPFDAPAYHQWRVAADDRWVDTTQSAFPVRPAGDPSEIATQLMAKYRADLVVPAPEILPATEGLLTTPAWSPQSFSGKGPQRLTLDASALIRNAGAYLVTFRYLKGDSSLTIQNVSIQQGGRELAADAHNGSTGNQHKNNTYRLNVKKLHPDQPVTLIMTVEPESSNDTTGVIEIRRKEELSTQP